MKKSVYLVRLTEDDRERFILDNQWAFKYGALLEFGERDNYFEEDGEIIARSTIEQSLDEPSNEAYRIMCDGRKVGGVVLSIDKETNHNSLDLFFIVPQEHGKGIGYGAWQAVEALHPETIVWETCTPYFEKRNIHFYVNKCGFHIVEFYNAHNPDPHMPMDACDDSGPDEMFRFEKIMK